MVELRDEFLSEEDLDLRNLSDEELKCVVGPVAPPSTDFQPR